MDKVKKMPKEKLIEQQLLQKLNEYGDSVLGAGASDKKKQKRLKRKVNSSENTSEHLTSSDISATASVQNRKKRKRKKKKGDNREHDNTEMEGECADIDAVTDKLGKVSGKEKQLELMKAQLGLTTFKTDLERKKRKLEEVEEKKGKGKKEPEVVVFSSRRSKKSALQTAMANKLGMEEDGPEFNLKQARFDVRKFGIKGLQGDQKDEAMTALLIQLGAKPLKNKYVNYKDFQEQKKVDIQKEVERTEQLRHQGYKIASKKRDRKRTKDKNDIGVVDGQVGKYKQGVQIVNPKMFGAKTAKIKK